MGFWKARQRIQKGGCVGRRNISTESVYTPHGVSFVRAACGRRAGVVDCVHGAIFKFARVVLGHFGAWFFFGFCPLLRDWVVFFHMKRAQELRSNTHHACYNDSFPRCTC